MSLSFSAFCLNNFVGFAKSAFLPPVHKNNLGKKLPKKLSFFYHFWKLNKLFRPVAENISAVVEIAFYVCRGTCRGKTYCFEEIRISCHFRTMSEHFQAFAQDNFVTIVEIAFHLSIGTIWGKQITKNVYDFLLIFGQLAEKIGPSSNILSKDRQNSNLPVQGEKGFFSVKEKCKPISDIQPKFIGYLS